MLLRRVIEHLRTQNWTAVGLDFVIVGVGVFIGLQVSNWNDARQTRDRERILLGRLYDEISELNDIRSEERKEIFERIDTLTDLRPVLFSKAPSRTITEYECRMISRSHILPRPADDVPALDEMVASGSLDIMKNTALKKHLREFLLYRESAREWHREGATDLFRLAHLYPDLLKIDFVPMEDKVSPTTMLSVDGLRNTVYCDLRDLKASQAFLNDYVDNLGRLSATVRYNYEGIDRRLDSLRIILAEETKRR
ncbi:hypothetical protein [Hyphococcus sp.]|uniref:hypothetical protein n=1 Tax=Hyphococcus sp. TaxID=2038636 RepID=UPI0020834C04|nr:MAG: hypothetical protein DHS20C04_23010 [Marinicaulis sp.]